jgi:hypothetical protein
LLLILGTTAKPSTRAATINKTMTIIPWVSCYLVTPPSLISFGIGVFVGNYRSAIIDEDFKKIWNREEITFSLDYGLKKVSERKKTDKFLLF